MLISMPIEVYDACSWTVVTVLSAESIVKVIIFLWSFLTLQGGQYKTRKTVDVLDLPKI